MDAEDILGDPLYAALYSLWYMDDDGHGEPTAKVEDVIFKLAERIRAGEFTETPSP